MALSHFRHGAHLGLGFEHHRARRLRGAYRFLVRRASELGWASARQSYVENETAKGRPQADVLEELDEIEAQIVMNVVCGAGSRSQHPRNKTLSCAVGGFALVAGCGAAAWGAYGGLGASASIGIAAMVTLVARELGELLIGMVTSR